ncbi:hypothetical protein C8J56DRAFT_387612 [Mycena floridula]|nr:hypothetical protein C8J56DRAFT_387612 [Mycena floridula]
MAGVTMLGPSDGSDSRNSVNVSIRLSVQSPLMLRTPDAATLLTIISTLPSGTTSRHLREYWARSLFNLPGALQALLDTSLLEYRSKTYSVLPVIRSYVLDPSRVPKNVAPLMVEGACQFLRDHNAEIGEPSYHKHKLARSAIEINLQTILLSATDSDLDIILALSTLAWHQYRTRPRLEVIEHAVKLSGAITDHGLKGRVLDYYSVILHHLNHYHSALEQYRIARKAFIGALDVRNAALVLLKIAAISAQVNRHFREIPLIRKAQIELANSNSPIFLKIARRSPPFLYPLFLSGKAPAMNQDMVECLMHLAYAYSRSRNYAKAIKPLTRARDLCSALSPQGARSAEMFARTYHTLGNYDEAENWALVAIKEWKQLGGSLEPSLWILGLTYISKCEYDQAIQTLMEGLEAAKIREDASWTVDIQLELGRAYMKKGDIETARGALEQAINQYRTLQGRSNCATCARFYLKKLDNPSRAPNPEETKALRNTFHVEDTL